jgi:hypothetical protein
MFGGLRDREKVISMPIDQKTFERSTVNLEEEILAFLKANRDKAYTSDEVMRKTSFQTQLDIAAAPIISVLIAANFVAFINDMAAKGKIKRKVVNNRMYFIAV